MSDTKELVFCKLKGCTCGNREIRLRDQRQVVLEGKVTIVPYCNEALKKFKERGIDIEKKWPYRKRPGMSK